MMPVTDERLRDTQADGDSGDDGNPYVPDMATLKALVDTLQDEQRRNERMAGELRQARKDLLDGLEGIGWANDSVTLHDLGHVLRYCADEHEELVKHREAYHRMRQVLYECSESMDKVRHQCEVFPPSRFG